MADSDAITFQITSNIETGTQDMQPIHVRVRGGILEVEDYVRKFARTFPGTLFSWKVEGTQWYG